MLSYLCQIETIGENDRKRRWTGENWREERDWVSVWDREKIHGWWLDLWRACPDRHLPTICTVFVWSSTSEHPMLHCKRICVAGWGAITLPSWTLRGSRHPCAPANLMPWDHHTSAEWNPPTIDTQHQQLQAQISRVQRVRAQDTSSVDQRFALWHPILQSAPHQIVFSTLQGRFTAMSQTTLVMISFTVQTGFAQRWWTERWPVKGCLDKTECENTFLTPGNLR